MNPLIRHAFVSPDASVYQALEVISRSPSQGGPVGIALVVEDENSLLGILTDGDLKRLNQKFENISNLKIKSVMKKNPISIEKDMLAAQALSIMNSKKITSLCVHSGKQKNKTIGIIHIHNILNANIS